MEASIININDIESFEYIEERNVYDITVEDNHNFFLKTNSNKILVHNSGKTQVLMELLLNTSLFYGWKHLVYFPDVGSNIEVIADLLHKKTGKSFDPLKSNHITDNEIIKEVDWLLYHFRILTKKDIKAKITPFEFWDMAVVMQKKEGLQTASIDSWKDMSHPYSEYGGYAQYLEAVLPYRNQVAEDNNLHIHTIIHPKLTDKDKNGNRKPPVPYDLKGGSEWFNSGKCMITVHREDTKSNFAKVIFNKIKPRSAGSIGEIELCFDTNTFTYYELIDKGFGTYTRNYASKKEELKQTKLHIKPNLNDEKNLDFDSNTKYKKPDGLPF